MTDSTKPEHRLRKVVLETTLGFFVGLTKTQKALNAMMTPRLTLVLRMLRRQHKTDETAILSLTMSKQTIVAFIALMPSMVLCQSVAVRGSVFSERNCLRTPIQYAQVVFINESDTAKKFSAITDTLGNFRLDVLTSVREREVQVPGRIALFQNYPNPFVGTAAISYQLDKESEVSLRIDNSIGRKIRSWHLGYRLQADMDSHGMAGMRLAVKSGRSCISIKSEQQVKHE